MRRGFTSPEVHSQKKAYAGSSWIFRKPYPLRHGDALQMLCEVSRSSLGKVSPRHLGNGSSMAYLPVPHIWSDMSTMAFMRIMPSVCAPLGALISEPFFTCTS